MPIFEFECSDSECQRLGERFESLLKRWDSPDPACPGCGKPLNRLPSAPKPIWLKPWAEYGRRECDYASGQYNPDGVTAYRVRSTRHLDGSPEKVLLKTRQDVKEFCRAEKLMMPDDLPAHGEISKDGRKFSTAGMQSQWI